MNQLESFRSDLCLDELPDLAKQIVLYQKMEDKWGDLDETTELEEGEFLTECGTHSEADVS